MMYASPEPRLEPREDKIVASCELCGGEITEFEEYYYGEDSGAVCRYCLDDVFHGLSSREKAERLGMEVL